MRRLGDDVGVTMLSGILAAMRWSETGLSGRVSAGELLQDAAERGGTGRNGRQRRDLQPLTRGSTSQERTAAAVIPAKTISLRLFSGLPVEPRQVQSLRHPWPERRLLYSENVPGAAEYHRISSNEASSAMAQTTHSTARRFLRTERARLASPGAQIPGAEGPGADETPRRV
jgi:hypothetical protein